MWDWGGFLVFLSPGSTGFCSLWTSPPSCLQPAISQVRVMGWRRDPPQRPCSFLSNPPCPPATSVLAAASPLLGMNWKEAPASGFSSSSAPCSSPRPAEHQGALAATGAADKPLQTPVPSGPITEGTCSRSRSLSCRRSGFSVLPRVRPSRHVQAASSSWNLQLARSRYWGPAHAGCQPTAAGAAPLLQAPQGSRRSVRAWGFLCRRHFKPRRPAQWLLAATSSDASVCWCPGPAWDDGASLRPSPHRTPPPLFRKRAWRSREVPVPAPLVHFPPGVRTPHLHFRCVWTYVSCKSVQAWGARLGATIWVLGMRKKSWNEAVVTAAGR